MIAATAKYGPNGTSWLLSFFNIINEMGRPIIEAKNIDIKEFNNPSTNPKVNINLISPPPIDSFLKKKSPNNFISHIITKDIIPYIIDIKVSFNPYVINNSIIRMILPIMSISSGIII